MKKLFSLLIIFCALTVGVFVLVFNVLSGTSLEIDKSEWEKVKNISNYQIVYSSKLPGYSDYKNSQLFENNPAELLKTGLNKVNNSWAQFGIVDTGIEGNRVNTNADNYIYLYKTNNADATAIENTNLDENDFIIRRIAGGDINIIGNDNNAVLAGVNFFLNECVVEGKGGVKEILVPGGTSGYHFDYSQAAANKIDGIDISEFIIVVDDINNWGIIKKAQTIQKKICDISNVLVPIVSETHKVTTINSSNHNYAEDAVAGIDNLLDKTNEQVMKNYENKHEIYISGFSNTRTDAMKILENFKSNEYYVGIKNGKLLILGESALSLNNACDYIINKLSEVQKGRTFRFSDKIAKTAVANYPKVIDIYVDEDKGLETNNGLSVNSAFKTIANAVVKFNELKATEDVKNSFVQVNVRILKGNYSAGDTKLEVPYNMSLNIMANGEDKPVLSSFKEIVLEDGKHKFTGTTKTLPAEGDGEPQTVVTYPSIRQVYDTSGKMLNMAQSAEGKTDSRKILYPQKEEDGPTEFAAINNLVTAYNEGLTDKDKKNNKGLNTSYPFTKYPIDVLSRKIYITGLDSVIDNLGPTLTGYEELWLDGQWQSFNLKISGAGKETLTLPKYENGVMVGSEEVLCRYVIVAEDKDDKGLPIQLRDQQFYKMYKSMLYKYGENYSSRGFTNRACRLLNCTNLLTSGSYVYNNYTGELTVKTSASKVYYAASTTLFDISNSNNITFDGITFTGVEYKDIVTKGTVFSQMGRVNEAHQITAAIYGSNTNNITIKNCNFSEINSNGVFFTNIVNNLTIENCSFKNIGMSAIIVGKAESTPTTAGWLRTAVRNCNIINNKIENTASLYYAYCAITVTKADGLKILHNTITDTSYTAISVGFGWNWSNQNYNYLECFNVNRAEIAYNYITNFMTKLKDGAAIYVLGANCKKEYTNYFNYMHDNYAVNRNPRKDATIYIYYLDGTASNWEVYNNVGGGGSVGCYSQFMTTAETHNNLIYNMYILKGTVNTDIRIDEKVYIPSDKRNVKVVENSVFVVTSDNSVVKKIQAAAGVKEK